ncbi:MAG: STAS domain-containing protein [Salinivirgaceae bacterium]|jgi:ABC-type transporter Mla MlaB component|nr:STAS domain-containing protein [Salinivirgaceae bacterium]
MAKKSFKSGVKNIIDSIDDAKTSTSSRNKTTKQKSSGKPATTVSINLSDALTVQNAVALKAELNDALKSKKVTISSDEITEIDLSAIQLLITFEKSAAQKNIPINWQLQPSEDVRRLVRLSGLNDFLDFYKPVEGA